MSCYRPPDAISETNPRIIDDSSARKLAGALKHCSYFETCATYGLNVETVFQVGESGRAQGGGIWPVWAICPVSVECGRGACLTECCNKIERVQMCDLSYALNSFDLPFFGSRLSSFSRTLYKYFLFVLQDRFI